ncbi:RING finger protein 141 [Scaptodrosophila lebanonensis]|uniref:RING finger protein 141 n=1 Tax=Drosophila lebanonensis TaxID=7225 RepID=A0A6J2UK25_DROLE|nr:RING finger protein 141 [Scaptodrosophila lebanonensis]
MDNQISSCCASSSSSSSLRRRSIYNLDVELCAFCLDRKQDPVHLPCKHSFCRTCLDIYREERNWVAKFCPLCRRSLSGSDKPSSWTMFLCILLVVLLFSLGPFYLLLLYW